MNDLLRDEHVLTNDLPFHLDLESASRYFARWVTRGTNHSTFSISTFLRSKEFTQLFYRTLGPDITEPLQLLAYMIRRVYTKKPASTHRGYAVDELYSIRDYLGNFLLAQLQTMLQPACLEASPAKRENLVALFLACFAMSWVTRYIYLIHVSIDLHARLISLAKTISREF